MAELFSPPRAVGERQTLVDMLAFHREVLIRKAEGLSVDELQRRLEPSELTLGGLLLHMALVEDMWFHHRIGGGGPIPPWTDLSPDTFPPKNTIKIAEGWTGAALTAELRAAIGRSDAIMATVDSLDQRALVPCHNGEIANVRWIVVHMIEEYARHCGHADFIRESIDGRVGN